MCKNGGLHVKAMGTSAGGPIDLIADADVCQLLRASIGHEDGRLAPATVIAGMAASPVRIDRVAERHERGFGDAVDDRVGPNFVERHPAELGRVERPDNGALLEQGERDPVVLPIDVEAEVVPAHQTTKDRTHVRFPQAPTITACPRDTSGRTARRGTSWRPATEPSTASGAPRPPGPGGGGGSRKRRSARWAMWPAGTCSSSAAGPRSGRSPWPRAGPAPSASTSPVNSSAT